MSLIGFIEKKKRTMAVAPHNLNEALELLNKYATYEDDWDTYGAPGINAQAVQTAKEDIQKLQLDEYPHIVPFGDGVQFEWFSTERDKFIELEYRDDGSRSILYGISSAPMNKWSERDQFPFERVKEVLEWFVEKE